MNDTNEEKKKQVFATRRKKYASLRVQSAFEEEKIRDRQDLITSPLIGKVKGFQVNNLDIGSPQKLQRMSTQSNYDNSRKLMVAQKGFTKTEIAISEFDDIPKLQIITSNGSYLGITPKNKSFMETPSISIDIF